MPKCITQNKYETVINIKTLEILKNIIEESEYSCIDDKKSNITHQGLYNVLYEIYENNIYSYIKLVNNICISKTSFFINNKELLDILREIHGNGNIIIRHYSTCCGIKKHNKKLCYNTALYKEITIIKPIIVERFCKDCISSNKIYSNIKKMCIHCNKVEPSFGKSGGKKEYCITCAELLFEDVFYNIKKGGKERKNKNVSDDYNNTSNKKLKIIENEFIVDNITK